MTTKKQELDAAFAYRKLAYEAADLWIVDLIKVHQRAIGELEARRRQLRISQTGEYENLKLSLTAVNILSWTVNDVNNTARNLRLDLAVDHAATLSLAEANFIKAKGGRRS